MSLKISWVKDAYSPLITLPVSKTHVLFAKQDFPFDSVEYCRDNFPRDETDAGILAIKGSSPPSSSKSIYKKF